MDHLVRIREVFGDIERPGEFVDPTHCCECADHNETLLAHTPETISLQELGNPGWDPVCFIRSIEAFKYYIPALTRLATGAGDDYYLDQFLFHLNRDRIEALNIRERNAIADFLESLIVEMLDEIERNGDIDELCDCIVNLRGTADT